MAAKLILSMDGTVLQDYALMKERMTIGRKPHNDIVIDNLAVSGEHAAIVTILNDSFLEDLDSTNGVMVNGAPIKKHFLQNNDVIEIGKYKLRYLNMQPAQQGQAEGDFEKTIVLRAPPKAPAVSPSAAAQAPQEAPASVSAATAKHAVPPAASAAPAQPVTAQPASAPADAGAATAAHPATPAPEAQPAAGVPLAAVQILTGPNAGRELDLVKNLTTLGKPGVQVVVVTRRPHGYFITHVEGANFPSVNGKVLDAHQHPLNNHDIIDLAGVKMEFFFKN